MSRKPQLFAVPTAQALATLEVELRVPERERMVDSPCRDNPEAMFPEVGDVGMRSAAKAICRNCTIRSECLAGAIDRGERYGIWGGVDFLVERHRAEKSRKRSA